MYRERTMTAMHTVSSNKRAGIMFRQNMLHREIIVEFQMKINSQFELFRFTIPFTHLSTIYRVDGGVDDNVELVVSLPTPPRFFRKLDEEDTHEVKARYWSQRDAWYRQTDITHSPAELKTSPVALKKPKPIIDIGESGMICDDSSRCQVFVFCLPKTYPFYCRTLDNLPATIWIVF